VAVAEAPSCKWIDPAQNHSLDACDGDHGWSKSGKDGPESQKKLVVGLWFATAALLDLAQNALDADRKRWLFAMLAVRQMSQVLG